MKKRFVSTLLLLSMIAALASCQSSRGGVTEKDSTDDTTPVTEPVDDSPRLELPADADFGGETFRMLVPTQKNYEYISEEATGDVVSDAVYERNQKVEELLNVTFEFVDRPGEWSDRNTYNGIITSSILANDQEYDLMTGYVVITLPLAAEGYFINANTINYLNLDNPWWVQGMNDDLAIDGKLYGFIGDASLSLYKDLAVMYFNKKILNDYNLADPYDYVRNGSWTIDTFAGLIKGVSSDLNNDGKLTFGDDMVGFMNNPVANRSLATSTEMKMISMGKNGVPELGELSERSVDIYDKLYKLFMENGNVVMNPQDEYDIQTKNFTEDKALFMNALLNAADNMRDMPSDFGIVPFPKADENQEHYHTQIGTSTNMMFIPQTTRNADMVGMVCEALSYYSMIDVVPKYYEVALKEKYTRDDDVKEMLEIIRESAMMDFNFAYSTCFDPFTNSITEYRQGWPENLTSYHASNLPKWQSTLNDLVEKISALE
ncbi:MAG: hypothetical protein HFE63_03460 [Clostridiales bacterium]|nr:hypothetical protein [Clostridiales bacterium]